MMVTTQSKLTTTQREILLHRLAVADALAECVGETMAEDRCGGDLEHPQFQEFADEFGDAAFQSAMRLDAHFRNGGELSNLWELSDIDKQVLRDVIDGSTWIGCMEGNCPESLIVRHYNIGRKLAAMVSEVIGRKVQFPDS